MKRMIERWFPCAEVSATSNTGWGSGKTESALFTWFAKRPTAQAKAAVLCSLLPWPDDAAEQKKLQDLVQEAMQGRYQAWRKIRDAIEASTSPGQLSLIDPFSGRGMIPLEAARLGLSAMAVDYSPVAVIASEILTNYPFRDWTAEPSVKFENDAETLLDARPRLVRDGEAVLKEVGRRYQESMQVFYPEVSGKRPWAYLWAVTLPCQECGHRFPLIGNNLLHAPRYRPATRGREAYHDPGQSMYISADRATGTWEAIVHSGLPKHAATLAKASGPDGRLVDGKSAVCPFCSHSHPLALHRRLTNEGQGRDALVVIADFDEVSKSFRAPTQEELEAAAAAEKALIQEDPFNPGVPAVPDEGIGPGNNNIIGPSIYGARTYGDLMCSRQTLGFVRLSRIIGEICEELRRDRRISADYVRALGGLAGAVLVRRLRRSTRGSALMVYADGRPPGINNIYANEGSITFSYDFLETGLAGGSGTWEELSERLIRELADVMPTKPGMAVDVSRGTATSLPIRDRSVAVVVTDPPYDEMIAYSDSSDLLYAWLKRALRNSHPDLCLTSDPLGVQEKTEEIIVKRSRGIAKSDIREHRTREHYDTKMAAAFREMRRVVMDDGIVTIVFGHGEPEVWQRLLRSIEQADMVMTGSWPANTETGGQQGKANIRTTLTMCCRPAPTGRPIGRKGAVEAAIKAEIKRRYPDWERWGLAPADMLMAAAGPAMEVVGRYSEVLDATGQHIDIYTFLPLARAAVQEAMAVEIDNHPLEHFDARTRFGLWWVRLYSRQVHPKSELRWQVLASQLDLAEVRDLVPTTDKGVRFTTSRQLKPRISPDSATIDVALALAAASEEGLAAMGEVLGASGRGADDPYLWAAVKFLADRLPDSDPDAVAFARVLRTRDGIVSNADRMIAVEIETRRRLAAQGQLW